MSCTCSHSLNSSPSLKPKSCKPSIFSIPSIDFHPHQRIISLRDLKLNAQAENSTPSCNSSLHQKAQSMFIHAKRLEDRIKKLEESIGKQKKKEIFTPKTQYSEELKEENSIGVSCSSEDSVSLLRKQVESIKNFKNSQVHDKIKEKNYPQMFDLDKISVNHAETIIEIPKKDKKISYLAVFRSIPSIHLETLKF
jgi:hypothetical protein